MAEDDAAGSQETGDKEQIAAVKGNPLGQAERLAETLNQKREPLKDPSQWRNVQGTGESAGENAGSGPEGKSPAKKKSDPHPCEKAADLAQRGGLMRLLYRQGNNPAFSRLEGPEGKAVWIDLWQRAFGPADENRNPKLERRQASFAFPVSNFEIQEVAEITWDRIQMHLQHREEEAAKVKEVLEAAISAKRAAAEGIDPALRGRWTIDDCPADETRGPNADWGGESQVAGDESRAPQPETEAGERVSNFEFRVSSTELGVALLGALGVYKCMGAVLEAGKDIKSAYYRMLVALYGELPSFEFFKPKPPTLSDLTLDLSDFVMNLFSPKDGPSQQEKQKQIKWRGSSGGRQPGGGP
jgi:hypothetical protein